MMEGNTPNLRLPISYPLAKTLHNHHFAHCRLSFLAIHSQLLNETCEMCAENTRLHTYLYPTPQKLISSIPYQYHSFFSPSYPAQKLNTHFAYIDFFPSHQHSRTYSCPQHPTPPPNRQRHRHPSHAKSQSSAAHDRMVI